MDRISELVVKNVDAGFRLTALAIDQQVVISTPVDTGRARSNWRVSANIPATDIVEPYVPGESGLTGGQNAQAAIRAGKAAIDGAPRGTRSLYISNNLPYIQALNDGSSAQAPAGFIQLAVQAGLAIVRNIRALTGA